MPPFGFWTTLTFSTLVLLLACLPRIREMRFNAAPSGLALGILSALALYLFFWSGYQVAKNIPGFVQTITSVYGLRGGVSQQDISLLLLFPIGPTEELYWRGLIQKSLNERMKPNQSLLLTSVIYASIHIPTLNPSLLLVAFIGGLVWGALYNRYGSILPSLLSHVIFDEMIFVYLVIS